LKVIDTSLAIPALVAWHEASSAARSIAHAAHIPGHARLETYSVLTRLPPPHRLAPGVVSELLDRWFPPERTLIPTSALGLSIVDRCSRLGVTGGAVYDALVGLTADEAGAEILSRDRRATRTYQRLGIRFQLADA
jgi:predicted nucleic acid-binding protein